MKLTLTTKSVPSSAIYYCEWTQAYFEEMCVILEYKNAVQNGRLNDQVKKLLLRDISAGYARLKSRFDVDKTQMDDEADTLLRLINTLSGEQYVELAKNILTPYRHLEFDEASLERLDKLGDS